MKTFSPFSILFLAVAFGTGAGIIGAAWTLNYLHDYSAALENFSGPINLTGAREFSGPQNFNEAVKTVKENLSPASLEIFSRDSSGFYERGHGEASGFFITSDGWLVTTAENFPLEKATAAVVLFNNKIFPIQRGVAGQTAPVTFLKIEAANLPVVSFGDSSVSQPGDDIFIVPSSDSLIGSTFFRSINTAGVSRPAETNSRRLLLVDSLSSRLAGAAAANSSGEVVGLLLPEVSATTATVLPLTALRPTIFSLLKDGKIETFWFGANVTNLQNTIDYSENETRGHWFGEMINSVSFDGPAASAGLKKNDIILSVGGLSLAGFFLDELLADYHPGDTVSLTIDREGSEQNIEVVLGAK